MLYDEIVVLHRPTSRKKRETWRWRRLYNLTDSDFDTVKFAELVRSLKITSFTTALRQHRRPHGVTPSTVTFWISCSILIPPHKGIAQVNKGRHWLTVSVTHLVGF